MGIWIKPALGALLAMTLTLGSAAADVNVMIDPARHSTWQIDKLIFGRFSEHHGRDIYPGIYDQHIANGSFENWDHPYTELKAELLYPEITPTRNVAYPWEPWVDLKSGFSADSKTTWSIERGGSPRGELFQRVTVGGAGNNSGVYQRLALPDKRAQEYKLSFQVRGSGIEQCNVAILTSLKRLAAKATIPVTEQWEKHTITLRLEAFGSRYKGQDPFGEYLVVFEITEPGSLDIDDVELMPTDAVNGKYNPTTLANMREFGVTTIRWPGGNFASNYHWRDGVGPVEQRPVRPNMVWGGFEPNYFGTNEFLEYCRLVGVEPLLNVGFNPEITPQEAADWVQYVNGSIDTPMGALRASHGYPEPWNVKLWQVGNEVYGSYQIGHASAAEYAKGFGPYVEAMKAVDPTIKVFAVGLDPAQTQHGALLWNREMFTTAAPYLEVLDMHRYVRGVVNAAERLKWNPDEYNQALITFPALYEQLIQEVRRTAAGYGLPNLQLEIGEWNLTPESSPGWPRPVRTTMAHGAFSAGMYNAFIRQGEAVRYTYQNSFDLHFRATPYHTMPPVPASYVLRLYSEPFRSGGSYHALDLKTTGPTYFMPAQGSDTRPVANVPLVDAAGVIAPEANALYIFLVNRDLKAKHTVSLSLAPGWKPVGEAEATLLAPVGSPMVDQTSWDGPNALAVSKSTAKLDSGAQMQVELPIAGVMRIALKAEAEPGVVVSAPVKMFDPSADLSAAQPASSAAGTSLARAGMSFSDDFNADALSDVWENVPLHKADNQRLNHNTPPDIAIFVADGKLRFLGSEKGNDANAWYGRGLKLKHALQGSSVAQIDFADLEAFSDITPTKRAAIGLRLQKDADNWIEVRQTDDIDGDKVEFHAYNFGARSGRWKLAESAPGNIKVAFNNKTGEVEYYLNGELMDIVAMPGLVDSTYHVYITGYSSNAQNNIRCEVDNFRVEIVD